MPAPSSSSSDVLAALRAATGPRHAVLDSSMPLAKAHPSIDDYRDHLLLLHAWLGPIETWLAQFADGPQDSGVLSPIRRTPIIEADLAHASIAPVDAFAPVTFPPSPHSSRAYRWGVCYVVEGSQLGGAVLYKRLRAQLAPHPLQYLGGNGAPVGPRWQQFVQALQAHVTDHAAIAAACDGATDAFDTLLSLLPDQADQLAGSFTGRD
ncbi:biliverdin-producing heme oxygenase [Paraburkholderia sp. DHOC27]|uniref:biliverdin-producing heme oxygenase n=1 Tax=Paraburkholderia sp. DHOC27 TaxID=2303330 RepID=UPI000E3D3377|nr:biliverdin-producing heme oxygenase [Paraburkholderia sp. DHOC27]RFU44952.1 heme oxygenase [Paraburkholderia sp. DHOC27]